jgi:ribosomal protein S12 methylthiotransferase
VRTNLIIGFPGETKQDFEQLKKFVQEQNFDNIALFEYHDEPFATSSKLDKKVNDKEIRRRFLELKKIVDKQLTANAKKRK